MSSVIKSPFVSFTEQKKTIEVVSSKDVKIINNYKEKPKKDTEFHEGLSEVQRLAEEEAAAANEVFFGKHQVFLDQTYNEVVEKAKQEALVIIENAKEEAIHIENDAKVKGRKEGMKTGREEAMAQVAQLKQDLEDDIKALEDDKKTFYRGIEPKIAEIVKTLVCNMVGIQKYDKETILFVIRKGLEEVDVQGDLVIKVSAQDFDEVMQSKPFLEENMSSQLRLEILKDPKMIKNDCIIETNLGNINCSLNDRMNGLLKQLSLIGKSFRAH